MSDTILDALRSADKELESLYRYVKATNRTRLISIQKTRDKIAKAIEDYQECLACVEEASPGHFDRCIAGDR